MKEQKVTPLLLGFLTLLTGVAIVVVLITMALMSGVKADFHGRLKADAWGEPKPQWLYQYQKEFVDGLQFRWDATTTWRREPFLGKLININQAGLRVVINSDDENPEATKIGIYGSSCGWGYGARDGQTSSSLLASLLNQKGSYKVTNYSESGFRLNQNLSLIVDHYRSGRLPDQVILYFGTSDVMAAIQSGTAEANLKEHRRKAEFNTTTDYPKLLNLFVRQTLRSARNFVTHRSVDFTSERLRSRLLDPVVVQDVCQRLTNSIDIVRQLVGSRKLFLFYEATVFARDPVGPYETDHHQKYPELKESFSLVEKCVRNQLPEVTFMADMPFMKEETPLYVDAFHYGEYGHKKLAEAVFQGMVK